MFFWYNNLPQEVPLIAVLFPLLHVGVGVCLTYYVLAGWLNRTHNQMTPAQIAEAERLVAEWKPGDCGAEGRTAESTK